jgi:hypothetical protein
MTTTTTTKNNTDRLFLSRLSETYKCRLGDNLIIECYVRHQRIKSIAWYAKGEHVDLRGVRIWYRYEPTTGQCVLYLRSVLSCDEGSYCCEATSIDNVVETLEVKLLIDNRKFSFIKNKNIETVFLGDKSWRKIPVLHMAGRVVPGGKKMSSIKTLFQSFFLRC